MTQEYYVLGANRSARLVCAFLDCFLPRRTAFIEEYPVPECADQPMFVLQTEQEILTYLEEHPSEPYGLYWNDADPASAGQAMAFYTRDGKLIFGLADQEEVVTAKLQELVSFVGSSYVLRGSEQRPPETASEFIALCKEQAN